ncbi:MAG TPA: IS4 family transposase [Aggregatilineales bacterium]|nr:IS4 family transposase [Aggregatilineales bacterium]
MFKDKYSRQQERLVDLLETSARRLGKTTGFVQRQSKLSAAVFVQGLVLTWLEKPLASLSVVAQSCSELGVEISVAGLQQRLNGAAVALLRGLVEQALALQSSLALVPEGVLRAFSAIYVLDSTSWALPAHLKGLFEGQDYRGERGEVKIQLSFDYKAGNIAALEVMAGREADQNCQQHVELAGPGTLHLFDLGFFKVQVFQALSGLGAYFISRLQSQTGIYELGQAGQALDLVATLEGQESVLGEMEIAIGRQCHLKVRLIFEHLPPDVVAQRRRKAKEAARRGGYIPSERHLALLGYALFITNIPSHILAPKHIILLYRLRWQVELIFKLWKSQALLSTIPHCGKCRFLCQFYARLLALLLFHQLLDGLPLPPPYAELSLPKAFSLIQGFASQLQQALSEHSQRAWTRFFQALHRQLLHLALKQKRRKHPSTLALILAQAL